MRLVTTQPQTYHAIIPMAAVGPIPTPGATPDGDSRALTMVRLASLILLAGGSGYLLYAHGEWFSNPKALKFEVLSWGMWGPIAYVLLFAIGPSFLVPGAVMTIAGGLAFGAFWGAVWSLIGANSGALIAFAAGRFLGKSFVDSLTSERLRHRLDRLWRN